jgi:uncharacterized protein YndB with AHSA1/START domain
MKKLTFTQQINASREKVWKVLWDDATYRKWTTAFNAGSYAVSDWKEGSKVMFLGDNEDGMYSVIDKLVPNNLMSFKHLGIVKEGKEQPEDSATKAWAGAKENYTLTDKEGTTELKVEVDVTEDFEEYMKTTFPRSLSILKELAEGQ